MRKVRPAVPDIQASILDRLVAAAVQALRDQRGGGSFSRLS
jgi:hypothetical protein